MAIQDIPSNDFEWEQKKTRCSFKVSRVYVHAINSNGLVEQLDFLYWIHICIGNVPQMEPIDHVLFRIQLLSYSHSMLEPWLFMHWPTFFKLDPSGVADTPSRVWVHVIKGKGRRCQMCQNRFRSITRYRLDLPSSNLVQTSIPIIKENLLRSLGQTSRSPGSIVPKPLPIFLSKILGGQSVLQTSLVSSD